MATSTNLGGIRGYVRDALVPLVPDEWKVEDKIPTLDRTLTRPILWLEYSEFAPLPDTNPAALATAVQMDACIATNRTDVRAGEDDADQMVADLYHRLVSLRRFYGITARKAVFEQSYIGWRITFTIAANAQPQEG